MKTSEVLLRPRSVARAATLMLSLFMVLCIATSSVAYAADSDDATNDEPTNKERLAELKVKFKEAKKKKDVNSMRALLDSASDLYEDCCDEEKLQLEVLKFTGIAGKGTKGHEIKVLVMQELAEIGDLRAAKYVKTYLKQPDPKRASDTLKAAVEAASQLPDPSLVAPLLKIVTRSKTTGIMEEAVFALGKFKDARKYRGRILETLVGEARKVKPGNRPRMRGSQDSLNGNGTPYGRESGPGARWAALSASVPVALRELTGQDVRTLSEWMNLVKSHKGKYADLFVD